MRICVGTHCLKSITGTDLFSKILFSEDFFYHLNSFHTVRRAPYAVFIMNEITHKDSQTQPTERFRTGQVLTLSACHFIHDIYSSFLAPLLPLLIEKLSMTLTQAGLLSTVMQIPSLLNPLIGILADRRSVRYFIILAPVTTAVPMSLMGLAPNYGVLLILLFLTGISVAAFHVPTPVMIAQLSGDKKGKGMSFYMTGGELARTIGPLAAVGAL